jgi:hypothetical protein
MWWSSLTNMTFSMTFEKNVSNDMGLLFIILVLLPFLNNGFIWNISGDWGRYLLKEIYYKYKLTES